jgi:hypothetical protein
MPSCIGFLLGIKVIVLQTCSARRAALGAYGGDDHMRRFQPEMLGDNLHRR